MRTRIRSKLPRNLTKREYDFCYHNNFGSAGQLLSWLQRAVQDVEFHSNDRVFLLENQDTGQVFGWSMLKYDSVVDCDGGFYILEEHRRKGYGSRLARAMLKKAICDRYNVYANETLDGQVNFFTSLGVELESPYSFYPELSKGELVK